MYVVHVKEVTLDTCGEHSYHTVPVIRATGSRSHSVHVYERESKTAVFESECHLAACIIRRYFIFLWSGNMGDDLEYERVLLVKPDIFIFRIPPRTSNRGFRYVNCYKIHSNAPSFSRNEGLFVDDMVTEKMPPICLTFVHPQGEWLETRCTWLDWSIAFNIERK